MKNTNETLAIAPAHTQQLALSVFSTAEAFEHAQRAARLIASSDLVPQQFRGPAGIANCVLGLEMANRLGASPLAVLQNLYIVHGRPAWSSQFLISMVNASGRFQPLQFEMSGEGDEYGCTAAAKLKDGSDVVKGPKVTIGMAKAEGWFGKAGSKWQTMPELMLRYRAATFFARLYAPDLTLGMATQDEVVDISAHTVEVKQAQPFLKMTDTPTPEVPVDVVADDRAALIQKVNEALKAAGLNANSKAFRRALVQRRLMMPPAIVTQAKEQALEAILAALPEIASELGTGETNEQ